MLTTATQHYKKNGYYIAHNVFSDQQIKNTLYEMDIIIVQQLNLLGFKENPAETQESLYGHMKKLYAKDQSIYTQALRLCAKLFSLQTMVMHEKIAKTTKRLGITLPIFQTTPVLHIMTTDLKITRGYQGVGAHQDWPALQSGLDTITVWFPFMDVDANNFPLELVPASHKIGLYPGTPAEHIYQIDPLSYKDSDFIPIEVKCGDVLFMSNFILHRSGLNGDNRLRIACSSRYENANEKTFIERTYPCAQKRIIQRELLQPNFPTKEHLENIYE